MWWIKIFLLLQKEGSAKSNIKIIEAAQHWPKMRKILPTLQIEYRGERYPKGDHKSCSKTQSQHNAQINLGIQEQPCLVQMNPSGAPLYRNYQTIMYIAVCMLLYKRCSFKKSTSSPIQIRCESCLCEIMNGHMAWCMVSLRESTIRCYKLAKCWSGREREEKQTINLQPVSTQDTRSFVRETSGVHINTEELTTIPVG